MENPLIVLTTLPDADSAQALAGELIKNKLAACVNVLPAIHSVYEWKGEVAADPEHLLLIKTHGRRYSDLEGYIRQHHPYELPEIVALPIENGLAGYLDWIGEQTGV